MWSLNPSDAQPRAPRLGFFSAIALSLLCALALATPAPASAQVVVADPDFAKVGFDHWVASGPRTDIPWKLDISTAGLSIFQRFTARTEIHLNSGAISQRAGAGQLLFFVQFTDSHGAIFQSHNHIDLEGLENTREEAVFTQNVLAIPGDYRVDFAVFDSATQERSVAQRTMHIAQLHNDPLPNSWDAADSIEIVPDLGVPDRWFLPRATDKLHLRVDAATPVNLQIIASGAWSEELSAEKVLSQIEVPQGSSNLALLSYEHRSVFFDQDLAQPLNWPKLKAALATINPNAIDAQALGNRSANLEFFLDELSRRVDATHAPATDSAAHSLPVFIIMSPPWNFRDGEKVHPIRITDNDKRVVFYIRYGNRAPQQFRAPGVSNPPSPLGVGGTAVGDVMTTGNQHSNGVDFLEHTLAPLHPRLFDVTSPEDFRKAIATILRDITKASEASAAKNPKGSK